MTNSNKHWLNMIDWLKSQNDENAKLALHHLNLVDDLREALLDSDSVIANLQKETKEQSELLQAISVASEVISKSAKLQVSSTSEIEFSVDIAPFRNIMNTMYPLPKSRKTR